MQNYRRRGFFSRLIAGLGYLFVFYLIITGLVATIIGSIAVFQLFSQVTSSPSKSQGYVDKIEDNSILHIEINGPLEPNSDLGFVANLLGAEQRPSLEDVQLAMRRGARDDRVKAALLQLSEFSGSPGTVDSFSRALRKFIDSGKKFTFIMTQ